MLLDFEACSERGCCGETAEGQDMPQESSRETRRVYMKSFAEGVRITWPVLSVILAAKALLGAIVGLVEGWGVAKGVYFAFITGLTIGYGDFFPTGVLTRILAVLIGFCGIALSGLVAALAVKAFQATTRAQ
jgi:hypothetical protein